MSAYPNAPASINGVILAKFKSKDSVDAAFDFGNHQSQGICADVQEDIYDTVFHDVLTREQRSKYRSEGKKLTLSLMMMSRRLIIRPIRSVWERSGLMLIRPQK